MAQLALAKHHFHYTQTLGQNFIFDDGVLAAIASAAGVAEGQNVLEIGAGAGVLTRTMLEMGANVLAVEIDASLSPVLDEMLDGFARGKVIIGDALKIDLARAAADFFGGGRFRVVANLPYNLTTDIVLALVKSRLPIDEIAVTVQREAAERMMATPGDKRYCATAAVVQYFGAPSVLMEIPSSAFTPRPHVESCLFHIALYREKPVEAADERALLKFIDACFAMRRKTLVNNLLSAYPIDRTRAEALLARAGLDGRVRGEALSMRQLADVSDALAREMHFSNAN
jgi:16S rRNA (adenine1518-N6/adenine1519-N6)-dimethyltransferase